ncbi:calcium-translocating P-type ATPase, PMCA-type [Spirulina sp. CS-785/01]|uniref:calcium-translocating P-type ATPase, PMCA-type n=1 Tax=Spirulina sp. CS-785/01 TaxID=3021716 RepID=UPI003FA6FB11
MTLTYEKEKQNLRIRGLTPEQVLSHRQQHGENVLTPPERDPWWSLYLEKYEDPIIRILVVAAIASISIGVVNGQYIEGIGIIVAILIATTVGFLNEYKASQEFDILNQVNNETPVKVVRDGKYTTIPKQEVVVGDIVLIEAGDEIPADGQLFGAVSLKVNESSLTGESTPVPKVHRNAILADHNTPYTADKVLRGTSVVDGHGTVKITAVGDDTEIGKTAQAAIADTEEDTPLNQQLDQLSKLIGVLGLAIAVLLDLALIVRGIITGEFSLTGQQWYFTSILAMGILTALVRVWLPIVYDGLELAGSPLKAPAWLKNNSLTAWLKTLGLGISVFGYPLLFGWLMGWLPETPSQWLPTDEATALLTYFMIAVAVIVVAVPEGLALSVVLSLGYSMRKMTQQNTLVRQMHACETIGAATVICSDKTGTITLNEMRVNTAQFPNTLPFVAEAMAANSTANLQRNGETRPIGDPTEGALLLWLEEQGINYETVRDQFNEIDQWAFSSQRKYMATLGVSNQGKSILHLKGAPEIVLDQCTQMLTNSGIEPIPNKALLEEEMRSYEAAGMRLLGFAYCEDPDYTEGAKIEDLAHHLVWLGFVAIADPIRSDAPAAITACKNAQVQVKLVTGDNPITAREIARQIGLVTDTDGENCFLTGQEFAQLDDEQAKVVAQQLKVLSRARPSDKQRLVQLLQDAGEVVAVTGDGTNDAPALNQAQVGLAMGQTSSSVAKEASDMIILDHSFKSIENAVMWGRSLYQNIQKFILFQLTINVAACGIALLGPFLGVDLPLTVTQLLWVNLIMDTFAALALATEPPNEKVMDNPPRDADAFIISQPMAVNIFTVAPLFLAFFIGFLLYIQQDGVVTGYELSLFFTTFVMLQFWNLFNAKCFGLQESALVHLWNNKGFVAIASVIFLGQVLMVQFGGDFFRTVPLSFPDWLVIIGGTSVVLWVGEISRFLARLKTKVV